jgi:UDP-2-acetamido-3-amino-2,3-dideoxy-glucuronate N-acetyltransferase
MPEAAPGGGPPRELPPPYVHPTAVVDEGAVLEPGVKVWHFGHVSKGARLGRGTSLGQNVFVAPNVVIGAGCKIQNNVSLYEGVTLEDEVFVGPSAVFTNVGTPRAHVVRRGEYAPTLVRRRATIGANATIVCGTTLEEGAFVGAGAVVTADVPPYAVVLGVPARILGVACDCGVLLAKAGRPPVLAKTALRCASCGATYAPREGGGLVRTGAGGGRGAAGSAP